MLVLTRRINEKIIIGDEIEIVLVDIGKDQVKIGINAPKQVKVHRWEVYEEIQRENRQRRGGGRVLGEAALAAEPGAGDLQVLAQVIGREPTPEFAAFWRIHSPGFNSTKSCNNR